MAIDTLFQPTGSAGSASSSDYTKDHFQDTSRPGSNNTNLTSSASTNPLSFFFNDTDFPSFGIKTLWIKDLSLIEDRSKWIGDRPTYELNFTEYVPGVRAYVTGNVRIRNSSKGKCIELRSIGDLVGVTGVVKQLGWIAEPDTQSSASATAYTDAVSGSTLTFNSLATDAFQGATKYNVVLHSASVSSQNIHDYRLEAVQAGGTLSIAGILVYSDETFINFRPGSTYNDKTIVTTTVGATASPYSVVGNLGAATVINKSTSGAYTQSSQELTNITSIGIGSSGTNLVNVTTGSGSSFATGYAVVGAAGSSQYFGIVTSVSTDTLTVSPTLAFGISGSFYKYYSAGPTFSISPSYYSLKAALDPYQLNNVLQTSVFGATLQGEMCFVDPQNQYSVFSKDLQFQNIDGYYGLGFEGNTSAFLQIDGRFAAADIEYMSNGILHGTFAINGVNSWGVNAGSTGMFRKTVFTDAGPGWNSFVFSPGQSFIGTIFTKINLYDFAAPKGVTAGLLAEYQSFAATVNRGGVQNATIMQLGAMQRIYADQLYLNGAWTRGVTHTSAGGVYYGGASTNSVLNFQYFGKDFALVGTEGGSMTLTLDGASIGSGFNALKSVASLTWHTLALTYKAGATCVVQAVDFQPSTQREFESLQKKDALAQTSTISKVFIQTDTPRDAKDGDFWVDTKQNALTATSLWMRLFNQWCRLNITQTVDDPKLFTHLRSNGTATGADAGAAAVAESYNMAAWLSVTNSPVVSVSSSGSNSAYQLGVNGIDGRNSAGNVNAMHIRFNRNSWSVLTDRSTARSECASAAFNNFIYYNKGTISNHANASNVADKWNGSAFSSGTAWSNAMDTIACFVVGSIQSALGGFDVGSSATTTHDTRTTADSVSTSTVVPANSTTTEGSSSSSQSVISHVASQTSTNGSYIWNGTSWSGNIAVTYSNYAGQSNGTSSNGVNTTLLNGGNSALNSATVNTSARFNFVAWIRDTNSNLSIGRAFGGAL